MLQRNKQLDALPHTHQWQESRGFERLYDKNPHAQARFVRSLASMAAFETSRDKGRGVIDALEMIIIAFSDRYSEYLQPTYSLSGHDLGGGLYEADPILLDQIEGLRREQELKLSALEGEDFNTLYSGDPIFQARFVESLLGFSAVHSEFGSIERDSSIIVEEVNTVVTAFTRQFPEYVMAPNSDPALCRRAQALLEQPHAA